VALFQLVILLIFVAVMIKRALFLLFIGLQLVTLAQGPKSAFGKEPNDALAALYKEDYDKKREIKLDGKKYRIYSNYVTLGAGKAYNSIWKETFFVPAVDFNFHLRKTYMQMGGLLQGHSFGNNLQIQMHGCAGYHKESYKYFWAAYGGLSYTNGYYPKMLKDSQGKDSTKALKSMSETGLYLALQCFYKLKFDYGIGLTLFGDVNQKQYVIGARIELFFSGAYRGTILHKDEPQ